LTKTTAKIGSSSNLKLLRLMRRRGPSPSLCAATTISPGHSHVCGGPDENVVEFDLHRRARIRLVGNRPAGALNSDNTTPPHTDLGGRRQRGRFVDCAQRVSRHALAFRWTASFVQVPSITI
jgi:hypothetical protein